MREACTLLAVLLPRLEDECAEPSAGGPATGTIGRAAAAPVPGNPPAFFACTSIASSARWAEELLLYAVGASARDVNTRRGGSDANTVRVLTEVIPKLAAGLDGDEAYGLVLRELDARLDEARRLPAIDEAKLWRPLPSRPCPSCGCFFLRILLDAAARPTGHIECFGHLPSGAPCRAAWASLADIVPDLARADALTVPDLEELCALRASASVPTWAAIRTPIRSNTRSLRSRTVRP